MSWKAATNVQELHVEAKLYGLVKDAPGLLNGHRKRFWFLTAAAHMEAGVKKTTTDLVGFTVQVIWCPKYT